MQDVGMSEIDDYESNFVAASPRQFHWFLENIMIDFPSFAFFTSVACAQKGAIGMPAPLDLALDIWTILNLSTIISPLNSTINHGPPILVQLLTIEQAPLSSPSILYRTIPAAEQQNNASASRRAIRGSRFSLGEPTDLCPGNSGTNWMNFATGME